MPRLAITIGVLLLSLIVPISSAGADFSVAIDIGHSPDSGGAFSARNRPEYSYNFKMALMLLHELRRESRIRVFIINPEGEAISPQQRTDLINQAGPDFLISIHHDSVQPIYLSEWRYRGDPATYCDRYRGYSIFISGKNSKARLSRSYAMIIGNQLRKFGFFPSIHHAEKIKGEDRHQIDREAGVYSYDDLFVLKKSSCPAVLLECGIIKNRAEELLLRNPFYRRRLARAIRSAVRIIAAKSH
jgi:N-acetylmuramoyl-L-alanine amidase